MNINRNIVYSSVNSYSNSHNLDNDIYLKFNKNNLQRFLFQHFHTYLFIKLIAMTKIVISES